jgi:hypothetical protein
MTSNYFTTHNNPGGVEHRNNNDRSSANRRLSTATSLSSNAVPDSHRDILSLFIGSVKTSQDSSRVLRRKLFAQCTAEGPACQWHTTAHSCTGVVNASNSMLLFKRSRYCPAPAGNHHSN